MTYPPLRSEAWPAQSAKLWEEFQRTMYGWLPEPERLVFASETAIDEKHRITLKRLQSSRGIEIDALHARPDSEPRATFVALNFHGNHAVIEASSIPLPCKGAYDEPKDRGSERDAWCVDEILSAGFGLVTFCHSDVVPDDPERAAPILQWLSDQPLGTIAAWAWSLLSVANRISGPVVFVGHSRMGKAALLAGAIENSTSGGAAVIPRPVGVVSIQSGCGGAAPSRTKIGETVEQITSRFPHWFLPAFADYAGREDELPFDQHGLIALCAPKPTLLLNADDDLWANPAGQEAMAELARPIFESLGAGKSLQCRRRPGGHSVTPEDWAMILEFARAHW